MRKLVAFALFVTFSWIGGPAKDAGAGVTFDIWLEDATSPTGITFDCRAVGPGCTFGGAAGGSVSAGWCSRVLLLTNYDLDFVDVSMGVDYDTDTGLAIHSVYSWKGPVVGSPSKRCEPLTPVDNGSGEVRDFGCAIPGPPPPPPPVVPAGTYMIGTIVWDTSDMNWGIDSFSTVIDDLAHGMTAVINGNTVALGSNDIVVRSHEMLSFDQPDCDTEFCGSGGIDRRGEECDDGGRAPGDGCSEYCKIEPGWTCEGEPSVCSELSAVPSMTATGVTALGIVVLGIGTVGLVLVARRRLN